MQFWLPLHVLAAVTACGFLSSQPMFGRADADLAEPYADLGAFIRASRLLAGPVLMTRQPSTGA